MGLHPLRLLAAAVLLSLGALAGAPGASAQTGVPADWALKPSGLSGGDQFRLIFLTSTTRNGQSTDIADYNTFVQGRAAAGHQAIRSHSSGFRVVGCTEAVDARDNTSTTYTSADKGVPIYWLGGNRVANEYQDFYDGSWDDEANAKNESGLTRNIAGSSNRPMTGCNHDGTEAIFRGGGVTDSDALGRDLLRLGRLDSSTSSDGPLSTDNNVSSNNFRPLYGLSQVFQVNTPATGTPGISGFLRVDDVLTASVGDIADADGLTGARYEYQWVRVDETRETDIALANGTTYRLAGGDLGKTVKVRVSFTDDAGTAESVTSAAFPDGGVLAAAVCKAPTYTGGRREIWEAEMGVGNFADSILGYQPSNALGSLSETEFTHWGARQKIVEFSNVTLFGTSFMAFRLEHTPGPIERREVVNNDPRVELHVCDRTFSFGDRNIAFDIDLASWRWPSPGLGGPRPRAGWSSASRRTG